MIPSDQRNGTTLTYELVDHVGRLQRVYRPGFEALHTIEVMRLKGSRTLFGSHV